MQEKLLRAKNEEALNSERSQSEARMAAERAEWQVIASDCF